MMTEVLVGKTKSDALVVIEQFSNMLSGYENVGVPEEVRVLGVVRDFPARAKCVLLPWRTAIDAVTKES